MSFLNPLFLFGLAAAAIPIIIHLFTRRRPRELKFPSLEFLTEVNQSEIRRLRLKQWLLLLLRTLAVAAIALAMARPALKGTIGVHGSAATTVVILVDRSGSMGAGATAGAGGGSLATAARRVVENVLATLGTQDECLLVPYDRAPEPVTPRPSSDLGRLRSAAQSLDAGSYTTDHRRALEFGAQTLAASRALNRELYWISDFQSSGFVTAGGAPAGAFRAPDGPWNQARIYLIPVSPRARSNVALTEAALAPSEGDVTLSVGSRSFDAPPGDLSVQVEDAQRQPLGRGFLGVPEQGDATALLPLSKVPDQGGVAIIPDDVLPLDNRRWFASGRAGTLRVLVREDGPPSPLRLALEAGSPASGLAVEGVDASSLPSRITQADAVVINDVERLAPPELQALLDFHRAGGGVFLVLGTHADPAFWNGVLRNLNGGLLGDVEQPGAGGAWRLLVAASGHPVLAGFPARPGEAVSTARFQSVRAFKPDAGSRIVLEYDRTRPALVEFAHGFVFAGSLGSDASDFPLSGAFLPLAHQIARVLARGTAAASLVPGDRYTAPASTGTWRIEDAAGHEVASEIVTERGATRLRSAPLERPGIYRVSEGGTVRSTFAVNIDPAESDLTSRSDREIAAGFPFGRVKVLHPGADFARRVREARYGRELWSWFVALALLMLVAETILGRIGMPSRAPVTTAG